MLPKVTRETENAWLATSECVRAHTLHLEPGSLWHFRGFIAADGRRWVVPPGVYRLVGVATNVRTFQVCVCYRGVGSPDDGELYVCSLSDWQQNFEPPPEPVAPAPEPVVPKVAGQYSRGMGV